MGYKKIALPANNMAILANCFVPDRDSIQDLTATGDFRPDGGDWIRMYDPQSGVYTRAYWWGEGYGVYADADAEEPCADTGWGDGNENIVDYPLKAGDGFYAKVVGNGSIRMLGNVVSDGVVEIPVNNMALVGNPFPVDTDIQTIVASSEFRPDGGDWIRLYDPISGVYTRAYWWGDDYGVYENADADEPCADRGWGDGSQNIINSIVPAGYGFWCKSVNGGTLTFQNPLAK